MRHAIVYFRLCDDAMKNSLNLEVQFLLKQGQVEVQCGDFIPDYDDSILMHRGVVEDLNGTIRVRSMYLCIILISSLLPISVGWFLFFKKWTFRALSRALFRTFGG